MIYTYGGGGGGWGWGVGLGEQWLSRLTHRLGIEGLLVQGLPVSQCCVLISSLLLVQPREAGSHPNMTEICLTGTYKHQQEQK